MFQVEQVHDTAQILLAPLLEVVMHAIFKRHPFTFYVICIHGIEKLFRRKFCELYFVYV
jgi:hypothetical protein